MILQQMNLQSESKLIPPQEREHSGCWWIVCFPWTEPRDPQIPASLNFFQIWPWDLQKSVDLVWWMSVRFSLHLDSTCLPDICMADIMVFEVVSGVCIIWGCWMLVWVWVGGEGGDGGLRMAGLAKSAEMMATGPVKIILWTKWTSQIYFYYLL